MTRVFVTGGSGFIGRFLVRHLAARGCQVAALVRRNPQADGPWPATAHPVFGDILQPEVYRSEIEAADYVFHLAGCLRSLRQEDFWRVNVGGLESLLKCCEDAPQPPRVVIVSSLAAAGPSRDRPRIEADPPQPVSNYGRSKLDAERLAAGFADRVPITIVRPPIVLGEGDMMGLKMFTSVARWGIHLHPTLKRTEYSVIHVADLADLLWRAALSDQIVDADSFRQWDRAEHTATARGAKNPAELPHAAANERRPNDAPRWESDCEPLARSSGNRSGRRVLCRCRGSNLRRVGPPNRRGPRPPTSAGAAGRRSGHPLGRARRPVGQPNPPPARVSQCRQSARDRRRFLGVLGR